jgi:hypothetical protein
MCSPPQTLEHHTLNHHTANPLWGLVVFLCNTQHHGHLKIRVVLCGPICTRSFISLLD